MTKRTKYAAAAITLALLAILALLPPEYAAAEVWTSAPEPTAQPEPEPEPEPRRILFEDGSGRARGWPFCIPWAPCARGEAQTDDYVRPPRWARDRYWRFIVAHGFNGELTRREYRRFGRCVYAGLNCPATATPTGVPTTFEPDAAKVVR